MHPNDSHKSSQPPVGRVPGRGIRDEFHSALQGVASVNAKPASARAPASQTVGWGRQTSPSFGYRRARSESSDVAQWVVDPHTSQQLVDLDRRRSHDRDFAAAVAELASQVEARYGVTVRIEDDGRPKHTDDRSRALLCRSIFELFVDAAAHAGARRICVRLERGARTLDVTVEDDGLDMRASAARGGFGFSTIRERLGHAGGSMHIESVPEHGTKICLCVPLATDRNLNTRALQ